MISRFGTSNCNSRGCCNNSYRLHVLGWGRCIASRCNRCNRRCIPAWCRCCHSNRCCKYRYCRRRRSHCRRNKRSPSNCPKSTGQNRCNCCRRCSWFRSMHCSNRHWFCCSCPSGTGSCNRSFCRRFGRYCFGIGRWGMRCTSCCHCRWSKSPCRRTRSPCCRSRWRSPRPNNSRNCCSLSSAHRSQARTDGKTSRCSWSCFGRFLRRSCGTWRWRWTNRFSGICRSRRYASWCKRKHPNPSKNRTCNRCNRC